MSFTEEQAMEVATIYDSWQIDKKYSIGDYFTFGENGVGDPQLYKVISDHTSSAEWAPDIAVSLYIAIGLDDAGFPIWSQPTGAHDAYCTGDIVNYKGTLYQSLVDNNVYSPDVSPALWIIYT